MAIQWRWDEKCGEATLQQTIDGGAREFTLSLYTGNCYLIFLHEFEDNGEQLYNLHSFWADKKHMENCLGLTKGHDNMYSGYQTLTKFRMDMEKCRHWKEIAVALKKAFPDMVIELY
jgi:hypothetical protein